MVISHQLFKSDIPKPFKSQRNHIARLFKFLVNSLTM